jgi:DNA repair protein SbcD/Mre11
LARLRFVHAADLHLDSPFKGLREVGPVHVADRLVNATFSAYEAIIDLCIAERVDALLVAGDIYDGSDRSLRAQLKFVDGLNRLEAAGIRSFICHGNHDPLDGWEARLTLPAGCHRFGKRVEAVALGPGATVLGISYPTRDVTDNLALEFGSVPRSGFSIGLLHCNVGSNPEHAAYAPCTLDDLARAGIDYWALGHVHTRQVLSARSPTVVYPGNNQGRHANERGPRGVYLVEVDDSSQVSLDFRETSVLRWEAASVDISALQTEQDLLDAVDRAVAALVDGADGRDVVFRLNISGRGHLHHTVRRPNFIADLQERLAETWSESSPFAWCERVEVLSSPPFDRVARLEGGDFLGDLLRLIDAAREDPDMLTRLAGEMQPLYGHARAGRVLGNSTPSAEAVRELLDDAEAACLEALER